MHDVCAEFLEIKANRRRKDGRNKSGMSRKSYVRCQHALTVSPSRWLAVPDLPNLRMSICVARSSCHRCPIHKSQNDVRTYGSHNDLLMIQVECSYSTDDELL
jgi:hypothetical protein